MSTNITEYGETSTANLTETGQTLNGSVTEVGELMFGGYVEPTLQQVADGLELSDGILRHKQLFAVVDSLDAVDVTFNDRFLLPIVDRVALAEFTSVPACVLEALDDIAVGDEVFVSKNLIIDDGVNLLETVEHGVGPRRTRLFLVLGDLAIELTGN